MGHKVLVYFRRILAVVIGISIVLPFISKIHIFNMINLQFVAVLQKAIIDFSLFTAIVLGLLIIVTLIFGRVYCSTICPFGLFQELVTLIRKKKGKMQKSKPYKYVIMVIAFGVLLGGSAVVVRMIDPYSIFGSAVSVSIFGLVVSGIVAVLTFFKGRVFCTNICPVGAFLGLLSKFSYQKIHIVADRCKMCGLCFKNCPTGSIDLKNSKVNNETCIKCFNCLGACKFSAMRYGKEVKPEIKFDKSRRDFLAYGSMLVLFGAAFKSGVEIKDKLVQKFKDVILPAGAGNKKDFLNSCLNCNLCVKKCPAGIIKKATPDFPAVSLDYEKGYCRFGCHRCSMVCPSGAIKKITLEEKRRTQLGIAKIDTDVCIQCGLCVENCPKKTISQKDDGFPVVNELNCIGCGACKNGCPVKAISIATVPEQKLL